MHGSILSLCHKEIPTRVFRPKASLWHKRPMRSLDISPRPGHCPTWSPSRRWDWSRTRWSCPGTWPGTSTARCSQESPGRWWTRPRRGRNQYIALTFIFNCLLPWLDIWILSAVRLSEVKLCFSDNNKNIQSPLCVSCLLSPADQIWWIHYPYQPSPSPAGWGWQKCRGESVWKHTTISQ